MTFTELKAKEVINICDGGRLGHVIDVVFQEGVACIESLVVPGPANVWDVIKGTRDGYTISWGCVRRIGSDVILVEVEPEQFANAR